MRRREFIAGLGSGARSISIPTVGIIRSPIRASILPDQLRHAARKDDAPQQPRPLGSSGPAGEREGRDWKRAVFFQNDNLNCSLIPLDHVIVTVE